MPRQHPKPTNEDILLTEELMTTTRNMSNYYRHNQAFITLNDIVNGIRVPLVNKAHALLIEIYQDAVKPLSSTDKIIQYNPFSKSGPQRETLFENELHNTLRDNGYRT